MQSSHFRHVDHRNMEKCQNVKLFGEALKQKYSLWPENTLWPLISERGKFCFFEELSFNSFLFNSRKIFCCSWDFSCIFAHFSTEGPWVGCSLHPEGLELSWKWCSLFPDTAFSSWDLHWPVLNLSSIQAHIMQSGQQIINNLFRFKPGMKHERESDREKAATGYQQ